MQLLVQQNMKISMWQYCTSSPFPSLDFFRFFESEIFVKLPPLPLFGLRVSVVEVIVALENIISEAPGT